MGDTIRIVTISGPSGAGKTTLARELLARSPEFLILTSTTTRDPRPSDLPGEYEYVSSRRFTSLKRRNEFLWTVRIHGKQYGTKKTYVDQALAGTSLRHLMLITPDVLPFLRAYAHQKVMSFFIYVADQHALRRRLAERGEEHSALERRVRECAQWEQEARASAVPYVFVENDGTVAEAAERFLRILTGEDRT